MAKRFTETEIWEEDWYLSMPKDYKLFWFYMLSMCDHAGFYKVNLRSFCALNEVTVSSKIALEYFNSGKDRIRILNDNFWFIEDFIVFQYGTTFNINNPLHRGIKKLLDKHEISLETVRGFKEIILTSKRPQIEDSQGLKDKDKVKVISSNSNEESNSKRELDGNVRDEVVPQKKETQVVDKAMMMWMYGINNMEIDETKTIEMYIVQEMMKIWMQNIPKYYPDQSKDFPALLSMAYKIADKNQWKKDSILNGNMQSCCEEWGKIVAFTRNHNFYGGCSISTINNKFQDVNLQMNNTNGKGQYSNNSNRTTVNFSAGTRTKL